MKPFEISPLTNKPSKELTIKERSCFDLLDFLHIRYDYITYSRSPETPIETNQINNITQTIGIKNLVFRTRSKTHPKYFFFIVLSHERFDTKMFRNKYGISKIEMVQDEELHQLLHTTRGAVGVLDLIHDSNNQLQLYIDKRILNETYFRFPANSSTTMIRITMSDFIHHLIPYLHHELNII